MCSNNMFQFFEQYAIYIRQYKQYTKYTKYINYEYCHNNQHNTLIILNSNFLKNIDFVGNVWMVWKCIFGGHARPSSHDAPAPTKNTFPNHPNISNKNKQHIFSNKKRFQNDQRFMPILMALFIFCIFCITLYISYFI